MKTLNNITLLSVGCIILLAGLFGCSPYHTVIDNKNLVIYHAEERINSDYGKYEYWVRDNSTSGWRFISDEKYTVGDVLRICVIR
jgi:hypothetical protein